jgi:hypothetical protein
VASLSFLFIGKAIETVGALALTYVGAKVARIEWFIGRHFHGNESEENEDLKKIGIGLAEVVELRRKQFGPTEALLIAIGTSLVTIGCLVYLFGIWREH